MNDDFYDRVAYWTQQLVQLRDDSEPLRKRLYETHVALTPRESVLLRNHLIDTNAIITLLNNDLEFFKPAFVKKTFIQKLFRR